jgi:ribosomal protein S18 acetylase RimI-like enzyme
MPLSTVVAGTVPLQEAALALLFSHLPQEQREQQLADTYAAIARKEFSLDDLIVALDGEQVLGTVLAVPRPGGAAFLWPPVVREGALAGDISNELLAAVARRVDEQRVQFTQCLLEPADQIGRATLERGGFPYVTDLILLSRSLLPELPPSSDTQLSAETYTAASHRAFADIVERTYQGTRDCSILARFRRGEESLEAHRASGRFSPDAWRIYRLEEAEVGVLLLAEHPDRDTWEVAYLGVVPEARGRGIGRAILLDGLRLVKESGRPAIEIAVDAANAPALRVYRELGFVEVRRFAVHLRIQH